MRHRPPATRVAIILARRTFGGRDFKHRPPRVVFGWHHGDIQSIGFCKVCATDWVSIAKIWTDFYAFRLEFSAAAKASCKFAIIARPPICTPMPNNLWALLQPAMRKHRARPAWILRQSPARRVVTYDEIYHSALTVACDLRERGVHTGDTVALHAAGAEFAVAALAVWKIGAVIAPVHTSHSAFERERQWAALAPRLTLYARDLTDDTSVVPAAADNWMRISLTATAGARAAAELDMPTATAADDLAARIYTSGSAGDAKIVRLSHRNIIFNVHAAAALQTFTPADRFLALLPVSHAMGLLGNVLLPMYCGAAAVTPRRLTGAEILAALREEKISVVIAVPKLFRNVMLGLERKFQHGGVGLRAYLAMLKCAPRRLRAVINFPIRRKLGGRITAWVSGGAALDPRIIRRYHDLGLPLRQGYGLTETAPLVSIQSNFDRAPASVGRPIPGVRVKIHRPDARGRGEIWIQGPNVMSGYEDASQTAAALCGAWFKTGDLGRVDAGGRIYLSGRGKRLIVTDAGKNVYPEELETLLERDPLVQEAGVVECDARPVCILAFAEASAADNVTAATRARKTLTAFNRLVSAHNRITRAAVVDELPRTALGKIALRRLPEIFAANEIKLPPMRT